MQMREGSTLGNEEVKLGRSRIDVPDKTILLVMIRIKNCFETRQVSELL